MISSTRIVICAVVSAVFSLTFHYSNMFTTHNIATTETERQGVFPLGVLCGMDFPDLTLGLLTAFCPTTNC